MKTLKKILIGLVAVILILVAIGLTQPSDIVVERSLDIDAPIEMIYEQVNNLHNWEKWSPWHKIDPKMQVSYGLGGIGKNASYSWTSNHKSVGNGSLTIADAKEFEFINTVMDFGDQGTGTANFTFEKTDSGTKVTWNMHSNVGKNPIMRLMGIMIRKSINESYDRGLADIANQCDYLKETTWYYVKTKKKEAWKYYGIKSENVTMDLMMSTMQESYSKLYETMGKNNINPSGYPFTIYYTWGESFNMECAVGVDDNSTELKNIEANTIAENTFAILKLKGSYDGLMAAHEYMDTWLKNSKKEIAGPVIEKYKVGPAIEEDEEKWLTYILYPIKDM